MNGRESIAILVAWEDMSKNPAHNLVHETAALNGNLPFVVYAPISLVY
jgi:hypothetical protein